MNDIFLELQFPQVTRTLLVGRPNYPRKLICQASSFKADTQTIFVTGVLHTSDHWLSSSADIG